MIYIQFMLKGKHKKEKAPSFCLVGIISLIFAILLKIIRYISRKRESSANESLILVLCLIKNFHLGKRKNNYSFVDKNLDTSRLPAFYKTETGYCSVLFGYTQKHNLQSIWWRNRLSQADGFLTKSSTKWNHTCLKQKVRQKKLDDNH